MPSRRKKQDQKSKQQRDRSSGGRRLLSALKFASPTGQKQQREETTKDPKATKTRGVAKDDGAETSQTLGAQVVTPESSRLSDPKFSLSQQQQQQQGDQWPTAFSFSFQESEASEANVISPARSRGTSVASSAAPSRHSSDLDYLKAKDHGEAKPKQSVSRSNSIASSTGAPSETSHFSDLDNLLTAIPPKQLVPQEFGIPTSRSQQSFALSAADTTTSPFPSHLKSAGGRSVASGAPSETSHVSELDNLLTMVPGPLSPPSNLANQYDYESESPNQQFIPHELIIPSAASSRAPSRAASAVDTTASPPLPYYLQSLAGSRSTAASAAPSETSHVSELDNLLTLMPEPTANLADPYGYGGTPLVPQELVIPAASSSRQSAAALDTSNALSVSKSRRSSNSVTSSAPSESSHVSELDNLLTSMVPDVAVSRAQQRDVPMELVIPSTPSARAPPPAADTSPSFPSYIRAGSSVTSSLATDAISKKYSPTRRFKSDASVRSTSTSIREAVRQLELKAQEEREAAERQAKEESSYPFIQKDDVQALMCGIDRLHTYLEDVALNACWK